MQIYARLHAFLGGLFRPSEEQLTREIFDYVTAQMQSHGFSRRQGREAITEQIADEVIDRLSNENDDVDRHLIINLVGDLLDHEEMFLIPPLCTQVVVMRPKSG